MSKTLLAPPDELFVSSQEADAFEENRRPADLVGVAEIAQADFVLRDLDWTNLFAYVVDHPDVLGVLREAPERIQEFFGNVRPALDLVCDAEEGWDQLFIVVPTSDPPRAALSRLARLDRSWFNDAARRARFAINITVEPNV